MQKKLTGRLGHLYGRNKIATGNTTIKTSTAASPAYPHATIRKGRLRSFTAKSIAQPRKIEKEEVWKVYLPLKIHECLPNLQNNRGREDQSETASKQSKGNELTLKKELNIAIKRQETIRPQKTRRTNIARACEVRIAMEASLRG